MAKTATDLADTLAGLGEQIRTAAVTETRKDLAAAIKDQSTSSNSDIIATLDDAMPASLRNLRARFEAEGVPADFLRGIQYAAELLADPRFEDPEPARRGPLATGRATPCPKW